VGSIGILVENLEKLEIKVRRLFPTDFNDKIKVLDWRAENFFCYFLQNLWLAINNVIILMPTSFLSKYFDILFFSKYLFNCFENEVKWIAVPKSRLLDSAYNYTKKRDGLILNNKKTQHFMQLTC
jgi:hypothetical protein